MPISKEEMLKTIYDRVSDKSITPGCRVKVIVDGTADGEEWTTTYINVVKNNADVVYYTSLFAQKDTGGGSILFKKIIGHPVKLSEVIDFQFNTEEHREKREMSDRQIVEFFSSWVDNLLLLRRRRRKPIEEQSDECIAFVHSLLERTDT